MSKKPETAFRLKVQRRLDEVPNSWWESIQQRTIRGTPDIIGCVNGVFVGIELKTSKGKLSALQAHKIVKIREAGGIGVCLKPEELDSVMDFLHTLGGMHETKN